jgi:hypothetical protein
MIAFIDTRQCALFFALSLIVNVRPPARAQNSPLRVPRERVLAYEMKNSSIGPFSYPSGTPATGLVWTQNIIHDANVGSIRIHVKITDIVARNGWSIKFTDLKGREVKQRHFMESLLKIGESWSDEIQGAGGVVQLWVETSTSTPTVTIDKYAYEYKPSVQKSLYAHHLQPISAAPPEIIKLGNSVGKLTFMTIYGQASCSGFLVAIDLFVTNNHCIESDSQVDSAVVEFGYDTKTSKPDPYIATKLESTSVPLDYSILRLAGSPGLKYGSLKLLAVVVFASDTTPSPDLTSSKSMPFVIVQHPDGRPKEISIDKCQLKGTKRMGVSDTSDFGHTCDTEGGSSGSPVISLGTNEVVGLHHFGFADDDVDPVNQGIYMGQILADIQKTHPELVKDLTFVKSD